MRKFLIITLFLLLFAVRVDAATMPTYITGDTVSFISSKANVVTFNHVTHYIEIWNEDLDNDVYVDFKCADNSGKTGFSTTNTVKLIKVTPGGRSNGVTMNTIKLYFSTKNLGFISDSGTGNVTYRITGEMTLE